MKDKYKKTSPGGLAVDVVECEVAPVFARHPGVA
jgi:hypothetical protein